MSDDSTITVLHQPGAVTDALAREGARASRHIKLGAYHADRRL